MPLALLLVGIVALVSAARGTHKELGQQLAHDFTGEGNFLYWLAAIMIVGIVGNVPALRGPSRAFLALLLVGMMLANGGVWNRLVEAISAPPEPFKPALPGASALGGATNGGTGNGTTANGTTGGTAPMGATSGASANGASANGINDPNAWGRAAPGPEAEFSAQGLAASYVMGGETGPYGYVGGWAGKEIAYAAVDGDQQDQSANAGYGAAAGAMVGTMIMPGIGTAVGALLGAVFGGTVLAGEPDYATAWHYTYLGKRTADSAPSLIAAENGSLNGATVESIKTAGDALDTYIMQRATAEGYAPNPGADQTHFAVGLYKDKGDDPFWFNPDLRGASQQGNVRFKTWNEVADYAYQWLKDKAAIVPAASLTSDWHSLAALPPQAYGANYA